MGLRWVSRNCPDVRTAGEKTQDGVVIWTLVLAVVLIACAAGFAYSAGGNWSEWAGVGFTAAAIILAAATIGVLFGFLFGLPRARFIDKETGQRTDEDARKPARTGEHYLMNTNLIRVSDWLTTILVGVTLIQLGNIAPAARSLADSLESPLGGTANAGAFGLALAITAGIGGAVLFYLWTSVRVREIFEASEAEEAAVQDLLDKELAAHIETYRNTTNRSEVEKWMMLQLIRTASPEAKKQAFGELKHAGTIASEQTEKEAIDQLMCLFGQPPGWSNRRKSTRLSHNRSAKRPKSATVTKS